MNEENKLILRCLSILLSDPDGDNELVRMALMKEITRILNPEEQKNNSVGQGDFRFKTSDALSEESEVKK